MWYFKCSCEATRIQVLLHKFAFVWDMLSSDGLFLSWTKYPYHFNTSEYHQCSRCWGAHQLQWTDCLLCHYILVMLSFSTHVLWYFLIFCHHTIVTYFHAIRAIHYKWLYVISKLLLRQAKYFIVWSQNKHFFWYANNCMHKIFSNGYIVVFSATLV